MPHLSICTLGPLEVLLDAEPVSGFASDKVRALLAFLALSPDRPHRREALAGLLWPGYPERSARSSLRNALANLRQVIRDRDTSPPYLHSTHQTIE
ncbi:MAG: winged helix-turn-helix domain-containing protein, partial [Anaerolineae bacterium]